jgi:hypothetical protein
MYPFIIYMSDVNSPNNVLPYEKVSSTGGNTAAYENAYTGGAKKKSGRKTGRKTGRKSILSSLKRIFTWRKTAKRSRK